MLIFDAHLDLSMNALEWNRDLTRPIAEIRAREKDQQDKADRGHGTVCLPEMRRRGRSDGDLSSATGYRPALPRHARGHGHSLGIERDGRTNMPRNSIQTIAHGKIRRVRGGDHQMLFAVQHGRGVGEIEKNYAGMRILRRDRFMT